MATSVPSLGAGSAKSVYSGGSPQAFTTAAFTGAPNVSKDMVSVGNYIHGAFARCKMVSVKTKSVLVDEINELIGAVGDKFDSAEGDAGARLHGRALPRNALRQTARRLPTLSMHLLAHIAESPVGIVGLAARSGQLKGTASKHVQRLVEAGLVERSPIPGNRKEVVLSLTADGRLDQRRSQPHARRDEARSRSTSCPGTATPNCRSSPRCCGICSPPKKSGFGSRVRE